MKRYLVVIFFHFFTAIVLGQTGQGLQGVVMSGNSKEPLPGASITRYYQGRVSGLIANKEGKFIIPAGSL